MVHPLSIGPQGMGPKQLRTPTARVLAFAGAVLFVACSCSSGTATPAAAKGAILKGTFTLWGIKAQPNPCSARPDYADIAIGTRVTATTGKGRTVAKGTLSRPKPEPLHLGCVYQFTLNGLPRADFYTIAIGHRAGLTYSYNDLVQARWQAALSLGGIR